MLKSKIPYLLFILLFIACQHKSQECKVIIQIESEQNRKYFLDRVALVNEETATIDSASTINRFDSIVFTVPREQERLYLIRASKSRLRIMFVNDAPVIRIKVNYMNGRYSSAGPGATASLSKLDNMLYPIVRKIGIAKRNRKAPSDSIRRKTNKLFARSKEICIAFADTVKSPAAFLRVYDYIDFDTDFAALKKFITKAAVRFPSYKPIQDLKAQILGYADIMEKEFKVGELIPDVVLPDNTGVPFSTGSLRGKFYLIDFWSSFCPPCEPFYPMKDRVFKEFKQPNFEMVSVALDNDKQAWGNFIQTNHQNWIQLIDQGMWQGKAARTLKFDSIPYNFLVSPEGRILKEGIPADSLIREISAALDAYLK